MHSQHATPRTISRPGTTAPVLRGRGLALARAGWAVLFILNLGIFALAVPALYAHRGAPSGSARAELAGLGISEGLYAAYFTALLAVFGLGCFVVAAVIAYRRSDEPMALFASVFLALLGAVNHPNLQALAAAYPAWVSLLKFSWWMLWAALILFVFLFPDGRFAPRWMRVPVFFLVAGTLIALFFDEGSLVQPPDSLALVIVASLVVGACAQVYRYRRVSSPEGRQQTKWVVAAITTAILVQVVVIPADPLLARSGIPTVLYNAANVTLITLVFFLIPLSIGAAILRYRLWDIDLVINRALVYGTLTACVVGVYVLVVGGLGALLPVRGNLLVSILAAGLVAVLFQPLRERLQRVVNRLVYGERDDPYAVLSRLGQRLEASLAPNDVLPSIAQTVREALKLPHVAVEVERDGAFETAAAAGEPVGAPYRMPLVYGSETVGRLALGRRAGEEDFSRADRRLLDDLARQIGAAVHAARLTDEAVRLSEDLQRSRERLVTAREEERRRLRRDLHDGLGPQLAAVTMKAEAARDLLPVDPDCSEALLEDIIERAQEAVTDVRRLVYGLRPPALDELGLLGAIRAQAAHGEHNGLRVTVEASEDLPPLPAAVEVAAYRIVLEAVTNAARHAGARDCLVSLAVDEPEDILRLEVTDDGRGIPEDYSAGVGLHSMRERAAELGGSCVIEASAGGGARVRAVLPLARGTGGAGEA